MKNTVGCDYIRKAKMKNRDSAQTWQGCGETGLYMIAGGKVKWYSHSGKLFDSFLFWFGFLAALSSL